MQSSRLQTDLYRDISIIGIGETTVGRLPGYGPVQLQAWAALEAIKDAGLGLADVDGVINQDPYSTPYSMFALALLEYLGIRPTFATSVNVGGSVTVMSMLHQAALAISSGHCRYCLVVQGENMATSRPKGSRGQVLHARQGGDDYKEPFGVQGAPVAYAMMANRYFHEYAVTEEDLGLIALQTRRHALLNPNRQTNAPLTMDEYRASRYVAEPLRVLDCSLVSDGAGAFLLSSRSDAARLERRDISIRSFAMKATHCSVVGAVDFAELGAASAAERCYTQAGVGPKDMDLVLVHDAFTFSVLVQLDALGFAKPGEAAHLVREGTTALGSRWPLNTHGGLLSQAHCGGIFHGIEAVRQLRGEAGARQVEGARHAIWCGNGGVFSVFGSMIFGVN